MFKKLLARRGLSFERLRALLDLAEAGSLAKAADGDPTRQTQYSRQIKELEDYFGVELTRRRGHTLELTEAGERLVEIGHETFMRLEDFQGACEEQPVKVSIASGGSILQWLVLPHLGELQRNHRGLAVHLRDLRTEDIVSGLSDMSLDLGVIRESALRPPLKCARLFRLSYSLFVPKALLPQEGDVDWRKVLQQVPLALQASGGEFHQTLAKAAGKQHFRLQPALSCISFVQAACAVRTGNYAAVLPSIATAELDPAQIAQLPLPLLKSYERILCLAWNPRLVRLRPEMEKVVAQLGRCLRE